MSRTVIARIAAENGVRVNGELAGKNYRVRPGDIVEFNLPVPEDGSGPGAEDIPLVVVYSDEDLVVIDKPAGLCVHPSPGHFTGTLVNGLLAQFPRMAGVGSRVRPGIVHRLDLDTSGLIVAALTPLAYKSLTGMLKARTIHREYLAIVHGVPEPSSGTISLPMGRDPEHRRRFAVLSAASGLTTRPAITHYDVVERFPSAALVRLKLETGRTHQIRVHMQRIGHPVAGDKLYAPGRTELPIGRQALHAVRLAFRHPRFGLPLEFQSELAPDIAALLEDLRRNSR